jgi:hypothetical protein
MKLNRNSEKPEMGKLERIDRALDRVFLWEVSSVIAAVPTGGVTGFEIAQPSLIKSVAIGVGCIATAYSIKKLNEAEANLDELAPNLRQQAE